MRTVCLLVWEKLLSKEVFMHYVELSPSGRLEPCKHHTAQWFVYLATNADKLWSGVTHWKLMSFLSEHPVGVLRCRQLGFHRVMRHGRSLHQMQVLFPQCG